jgi:prephenate dehydratase
LTKKIKIGFFGEPGSNAENAARGHFGFYDKKDELKLEYLSFATVEDILEALIQCEIDEAVVPIENSTEGLVTFSADALINGNGIKVVGEVETRIRHNLIGIETIREIEEIVSIPQALSQCRKNIKKLKPFVKISSSDSTSAAVRKVAENDDPKIAAIGPVSAFEIYKSQNNRLKILAENIQDIEKNQTRFLILGREDKKPTGNDRTSIVFGVEDKPGALYLVLGILYANEVNMDHLSSRPLKTELGEYLFWVDIAGHKEDKDVKQALEKIAKKTTLLKVLGSYPKAE